ncbi:hypothetical protein DFJ73DRAFT_35592 [Zopfochytrium polystomum]|nr:hypothetical protein DFJ73DRAFT_35592 [Zopfochytrium polystomum]
MATTVGDDAANAAGNPKATTSTTPSTGPSSPSSKALSPRSMAPKLQGLLPNGDTGSADKAYHVFISYRVKTDAVLAEKLCDKLKSQVVESSSSFKDLRVSVFLDKEELVAGKRFEDQFLNALVSSCLVLPIISADSLALLEDASPLRVDNVLLEWDLTLDLAEAGHVVVIPILVGSNPEAGGYRRFSSFDTSRLADFCVPDTSRSVREIVSTMFAFQGVFVDPSDVSDKIRTIVARLSTEIWPSFRHRWKNATEIAPEAVKRCVQCGEGFKDSENVDGACAFHAGIRWQEYQCCRREKPCVRNKHSATHHNMFPYSAFFDWMQRIIQGDHTREVSDLFRNLR